MKEKLLRFMAGRYGGDEYSRFLSVAALVLVVLNVFLGRELGYLPALALIVYSDVRIFSRNFEKRRRENAAYLRIRNRVTGGVRNWLDRWKQRKEYAFFRCPGCKAMLRVPRGKGKIRVTCRKCGNAFERKT